MNTSLWIRSAITFAFCFFLAFETYSSTWNTVRSEQVAPLTWAAVTCENGSGWRSCNMPLIISLSASPASIVADGSESIITSTVTDYFGNNAGEGVRIAWSTSHGTLSGSLSTTDSSGKTSTVLKSERQLVNAKVTATAIDEGGSAEVVVQFLDKWVSTSPTYTAWVNDGPAYSCTNWSPSPSTVNAGVSFTQTATNCSQNQKRYRQNREVSVVTGNIRNLGTPIAEYRTLSNRTSTRIAVGSKISEVCYVNSPGLKTSGNYGVHQVRSGSTWVLGFFFNATLNDAFSAMFGSHASNPNTTFQVRGPGYNYWLQGLTVTYRGKTYRVGTRRSVNSNGSQYYPSATGYDICISN